VAHSGLIQIQRKPPREGERCDLCGAGMAPEHGHLVNVPSRSLLCVCRPCYLLFTQAGAGGARFRAVPDRYVWIPGLDEAEGWEALQVPIGLAFFFKNSATGRTTGFYPSPAGPVESELPLDALEPLAGRVPALATLAADVEALLIRKRLDDALQAFIVPIDFCYELVGRIRRSWRGMSGGDEVWREIDLLFSRAAERSRAEAHT
jgi:hypothetical protein